MRLPRLLILSFLVHASLHATPTELSSELQEGSPTGSYTGSLESDSELVTGVGDGASFRSTQSEQPVLNNSSTQIDEPSEHGAPGVLPTTPPRIRNLLLEEINRLRALEANQANAAVATPPSFFRNSDALVLVDLLLTPPLLAVAYYGKDNIEATYACYALASILMISRGTHQAVTAGIRNRSASVSPHTLLCMEKFVYGFTLLNAYVQYYSLTQGCACKSKDPEGYHRYILGMSIISLVTNFLVSVADFIWICEDFSYRWKQRPTPPQNA